MLIASAGFAEENVEIKASINADKIGIDDVLIYTLTFKGIDNPTQSALLHNRQNF